MESLSIEKMEKIQAGGCATDLGRAAGLLAGAILIGGFTAGFGGLVAGVAIGEAATYFAVTAPCFS